MEILNQDVQMVVLSYLCPEDIMNMYDQFQLTVAELYPQFVVNCTKIVDESVIVWFQNKKIRLKLFQSCVINKS